MALATASGGTGVAAPSDLVGGLKYAEGGAIYGPGTTTSDSIPAWVSNGEYVIRAAAVNKYGAAFFDAANSMRLPAFAGGGIVTGAALPSVDRYASAVLPLNDRAYRKAGLVGKSQEVVVTQHNYGDIHTDADVEKIMDDMGRMVQNAIMGGLA
jgi:hypothetical protein